jgi:hypothetical protein
MTAGGAVLGGLATSFIYSRFGPTKVDATGKVVLKSAGEFKLPGSDSRYGGLIYSLLIPVAGAWALHKAQPRVAQGMIIGGAVLLIQNVVALVQAQTGLAITGTRSYLNAGGTIGLRGALPTAGYSAIKAFGNSLDSGSAFRSNTWSMAKN